MSVGLLRDRLAEARHAPRIGRKGQAMQERPSRQDPGTNAEDSDYGRPGAARLPQVMLSVRFKNGNRRFFAYIDLAGGDYLGDVIRLYFHHATVMVRGMGLEELAGQAERQTVRYIREQHVSPSRPARRSATSSASRSGRRSWRRSASTGRGECLGRPAGRA